MDIDSYIGNFTIKLIVTGSEKTAHFALYFKIDLGR